MKRENESSKNAGLEVVIQCGANLLLAVNYQCIHACLCLDSGLLNTISKHTCAQCVTHTRMGTGNKNWPSDD